MASLIRNRITLVWSGLILATALSWVLGHGLGFSDPRYTGVAILVVAFVKVRFVMLDFMELRHAPLAMRAAAEVWVLALGVVLIALFLAPPHLAG